LKTNKRDRGGTVFKELKGIMLSLALKKKKRHLETDGEESHTYILAGLD
jgi:hypothetical protein